MKDIIKHLKENWIRYGFETIVVVAGILGAFMLNNWNENQKQKIIEIQYLKRLSIDLSNDITYYNRRISDSKSLITVHREFISQLYQKQSSLDDVKNLFANILWNSEQLTSQNSTYIELTNSGNLNVLRNQELRGSVINYYRENNLASIHISEFNEVSSRFLIEVGKQVPNLSKFYSFHDDLYDGVDIIFDEQFDFINDPTSKKFQTIDNAIATYKLKHSVFMDYFRKLKEISNQLYKDIQKELELRK